MIFFKSKNTIYLFLFFISVYHLITLHISPLPWFDEVFFANITETYNTTGKFLLTVSPALVGLEGEVLMYRTVYFLLNSIIMDIFGLSIYSFRLLNLIAGMIGLWLFFDTFIFRKIKSLLISTLIGIILFTDPIIILTLHSGRMEGLAFLFFVLAMRPLLRINDQPTQIRWVSLITSASFVSISLLTTPRIAVIYVGLLPFFLLSFYKKQINIIKLIVFSVVTVFIYLIWVFYKFGGILEFINYYKHLSSFAATTGLSIHIPFYEYPLVIIGLISIIGLIVCRKNTRNIIYHALVFALGIIFFHLIVTITSTAYYFYILPFYIFFIAQYLDIDYLNKKIKYIFIFCIIICNMGIFVIKTFEVTYAREQRNPSVIENFVKENLEINKKVGGNFAYFYAVRKNNNEFLSIEFHESKILKEADYLIINKYNSCIVDTLLFEKQAQLDMKKPLSFINKLLPFKITSTYEGTLYRRKSDNCTE